MIISQLVRAAVLAVAAAVMCVLGGGAASAHVTVHVPDSQPEKGGHGTVVFRVPNEEAAATNRLEVAVASSYGITTARTRPVTGWTAEIVRGPGGVVTGVVWTSRPDSEIPGGDEHYEDFGLTLGPLPQDVDALVLPAAQTTADGTVIHWSEQPGTDAPARPAPVVALAEPAPGTHGHHARADVAGSGDVPWLPVISLVLLGCVLAAGGVFILRRKELA